MTENQIKHLNSLRSTAHFRTRVVPVKAEEGESADEHGYRTKYNPQTNEHERVYQEKSTCQLSDNLADRYWVSGIGNSEEEALNNALANAGSMPDDQPMSPAEVVEQNKRLRDQLGEMEQRLARLEGREPATPSPGGASGPEQSGGDGNQLEGEAQPSQPSTSAT
jgi:hypothetical protein